MSYNPRMEIKRMVSKYVYRIEPNPDGGGFIARATDPNVPSLEAPTRQELQQKIQSTILQGLRADFPGLKLPSNSSESRFSFHVERTADGSFDIHSSDPNVSPVSAGGHDEVESHFAERMLTFLGKHMPEGVPESLRAQLASGNVKVFVKGSDFRVTTAPEGGVPQPGIEGAPFLDFAQISSSGSTAANTTFSSSGAAVDSSPITPASGLSGKTFRILVIVLALTALLFLFLKYR